MKKHIWDCKVLLLVIFVFCFAVASCKRREPESPFKNELPNTNTTLTITSSEQMPEPAVLEQGEQKPEVTNTEVETDSSLPTPQEIQTALKNSGYYDGEIDGKIGPKSKKAILDFQRDNSLEVDGKVGPKTWVKLKEHLSFSTEKE